MTAVPAMGALRDRLRWARFDRTLSLDPAGLARPVQAPPAGDFVICGAPRTGTTFLCALLHQEPEVVTVMQPWAGLRVPIGPLFTALRAEIDAGYLGSGRLDLAALRDSGTIRPLSEPRRFPVTVREGYRLGVKWPVFYRYLELLPATRFLVCVRHPAAVLDSYQRGAAHPGLRRFADGYPNPNGFNGEMIRHLRRTGRDAEHRRLLMFDYHYERILPFVNRRNVLLVRHERWYSEPDRLLEEISGFLGVPLDSGHVEIAPRPAPPDGPEIRSIMARSTTAAALGYTVR